MATAGLIISLISVAGAFISFELGRRSQTKTRQRVAYVLAVTLLVTGASSAWMSYRSSIDTEMKLELSHEEAAAATAKANAAQARIDEFRTPRRLEPETKATLAAKLKPYAGQKYDLKVFRDQDSLELANALATVLKEAGWVHTEVYLTYKTNYAETDREGVYVISPNEPTNSTSKARAALRRALQDGNLHDDSATIRPVACVEGTGATPETLKLKVIPCSESPIRTVEIGSTAIDDILPRDTLALHIGKHRL